jgi:hypothetical protein
VTYYTEGNGAPIKLYGALIAEEGAGPEGPTPTVEALSTFDDPEAGTLFLDLTLSFVDLAEDQDWIVVHVWSPDAAATYPNSLVFRLPNGIGPHTLRFEAARLPVGATAIVRAFYRGGRSDTNIIASRVVADPVVEVTPLSVQSNGGGAIRADAGWAAAEGTPVLTGAFNTRIVGQVRATSGDEWGASFPLPTETAPAPAGWLARFRWEAEDGDGNEYVGDYVSATVQAAIAPPPPPPDPEDPDIPPLDATNSELVCVSLEGALYMGLRITDTAHPLHPEQGGVGRLAWAGNIDVNGAERNQATQGNRADQHPTDFDDDEAEWYATWLLRLNVNGIEQSWGNKINSIGATETIYTAWTSSPTSSDLADWSPWSAPRTLLIVAPEAPVPDAPDTPTLAFLGISPGVVRWTITRGAAGTGSRDGISVSIAGSNFQTIAESTTSAVSLSNNVQVTITGWPSPLVASVAFPAAFRGQTVSFQVRDLNDNPDQSALAAGQFLVPADEVVDPPPPPPPPTSASASRRLNFYSEAEYNEPNYVAGDGLQLMCDLDQCRGNPSVIGQCQDVGGAWISFDRGASWWKPASRGLWTPLANQIKFDWQNPAIHALLVQGSFNPGEQGLYMTFDYGVNYEKKLTLPSGYADKARYGGLCNSPASVSGGRAQRWYGFINRLGVVGNSRTAVGPLYFIRSTDGGDTWSIVGDNYSLSQFGEISEARGHPTQINTFYFTSSTGFWRVTNANTNNPSFTNLAGSGGLPGGSYSKLSYIELVGGNVHIILGRGSGVYRSTNDGSSWDQIGSGQNIFDRLNISPWAPWHWVMIGDGQNIRYKANEGASWQSAASIQPRPGENGASFRPSHHRAVFFPQAGEVFAESGSAGWWKSFNHGRDWRISDDHFSGTHSGLRQSNGQGFSTSPDRWGVGLIDKGPYHTNRRGRGWRNFTMQNSAIGIRRKSCIAYARHPDPAVERHMCIVEDTTGGRFALSNGGNWYVPSGISTGTTKSVFVGWDVSDAPNYRYAYAIRSRSVNGGLEWSVMGAMPSGFEMWGMTRNAPGLGQGQALFAYDDDGTQNQIARSTDRGVSWQIVLIGLNINNPSPGGRAAGILLPHPSNHNRLFVQGPFSTVGPKVRCETIRLYRLDQGSPNSRPFQTINCVPGNIRNQLAPGAEFCAGSFAVDPRFPDSIWYVQNSNNGTGVPLIRTTDGGQTWTNLYGLVPDNRLTMLDVSPVTGDVIQTSTNGGFVIRPPYEQANTIFEAMGPTRPNRVLTGV